MSILECWCSLKLNLCCVMVTMPHSIMTIHSEHVINRRIWPFSTPHPYPWLEVCVKGHASMRQNTIANKEQGNGANIRDMLRQGEMVQTLGIWLQKWKASQRESRELKGEVYKKNRYLPRPVLSSYRPVDLYYHHWAPHWAPQMDHCWMRPVIHQARTQEDNTFFFLFNNGKQKTAGHIFMHTYDQLF